MMERNFLDYKIQFVGRWVLTNILVASVGGILLDNLTIRNYMILLMGYYFVANLGLRAVFATVELLKYTFYDCVLWRAKINNRIPLYRR